MKIEEYRETLEKLSVTPDQYSKPIRVYCDVDGVIQPYIYEEKDLEPLDEKVELSFYRYKWADEVETKTGLFYFRKSVREGLSALSHHPMVDFVWLTAWKMNAPLSLDKSLNIKSLGFLDWERKMSDYNHIFKKVAIKDDQKVSPSKFIWLEDLANKEDLYSQGLFSEMVSNYDVDFRDRKYENVIPEDRYLSINTDSYVGLLPEHFEKINEWISSIN